MANHQKGKGPPTSPSKGVADTVVDPVIPEVNATAAEVSEIAAIEALELKARRLKAEADIADNWRLRVSDDGRRLCTDSGDPWFWLGDTAWALFSRLGREDVERYQKR